jgi:hypothetical protein
MEIEYVRRLREGELPSGRHGYDNQCRCSPGTCGCSVENSLIQVNILREYLSFEDEL